MSSRLDKKSCQSCGSKFGLATYRHTCKRCRGAVCKDCSKVKIEIIGGKDKKPHKICINCQDDHHHGAYLRYKGQLSWGKDSKIMKQWLRNINVNELSSLSEQYQQILSKGSALTLQVQFQEYTLAVEAQMSSSMKHYSVSWQEMIQGVISNSQSFNGEQIDANTMKSSVIRVLRAFFSDFPDQSSVLALKQEYIDMAVFLLLFGRECSAWRLMKEIYGIIIPIESVSHVSHNDFTYGEKYLMSYLLDKLNYTPEQPEIGSIYHFVQDRGIELLNSFFINKLSFQISHLIFHHVISMPYNRRWTEMLRALGVLILVNEDLIGKSYGKIEWEEIKYELNAGTSWRDFKERLDVFCFFEVSDQRQMNRFSMLEESAQEEDDISVKLAVADLAEENRMLKKEVLQIFQVKQLILQKTQELEDVQARLSKFRVSSMQEEEDNILTETRKKLNGNQNEIGRNGSGQNNERTSSGSSHQEKEKQELKEKQISQNKGLVDNLEQDKCDKQNQGETNIKIQDEQISSNSAQKQSQMTQNGESKLDSLSCQGEIQSKLNKQNNEGENIIQTRIISDGQEIEQTQQQSDSEKLKESDLGSDEYVQSSQQTQIGQQEQQDNQAEILLLKEQNEIYRVQMEQQIETIKQQNEEVNERNKDVSKQLELVLAESKIQNETILKEKAQNASLLEQIKTIQSQHRILEELNKTISQEKQQLSGLIDTAKGQLEESQKSQKNQKEMLQVNEQLVNDLKEQLEESQQNLKIIQIELNNLAESKILNNQNYSMEDQKQEVIQSESQTLKEINQTTELANGEDTKEEKPKETNNICEVIKIDSINAVHPQDCHINPLKQEISAEVLQNNNSNNQTCSLEADKQQQQQPISLLESLTACQIILSAFLLKIVFKQE